MDVGGGQSKRKTLSHMTCQEPNDEYNVQI